MVDPYAIVRRLTGYELISPKDARLLTEAVDGLIGELGSKDARIAELEAEVERLTKEAESYRDIALTAASAPESVVVSVADIKAWRAEWMDANDPQDGTDCVTPFDKYLYTRPTERTVKVDDIAAIIYSEMEWASALPGDPGEPIISWDDCDDSPAFAKGRARAAARRILSSLTAGGGDE